MDATGMTLMPGLIDGHVHLTLDKRLYSPHDAREDVLSLDDPDRRLIKATRNAQVALAAGVTTVRDCGAADYSVLSLRDAIDEGQIVGPRVLACGRPVTTTGGHIFTGWGVDTSDEMKKAVRHVASRRADFVKLIVSGGTTSPGSNISRSQYSLDEIKAAVADAHRLGLPVVAHAISTDSIRLSAEAAVDTIEHCSWIGADPSTTVTDDEAVRHMVRNHVHVDHAIIPRPYQFPDEEAPEPTPEERWWLKMLQIRWPFLHKMRERGVTVFVGTDAAFGPWPGTNLWPGFEDMARALEILVTHAGFTPSDAISMATHEAAKALGLDREIGTVEEGKRADLILVPGDPLSDIRALRKIAFVIRSGEIVGQHGKIAVDRPSDQGSGQRHWELPA
jgi:imidazolonepropionase-like amidohydrolase